MTNYVIKADGSGYVLMNKTTGEVFEERFKSAVPFYGKNYAIVQRPNSSKYMLFNLETGSLYPQEFDKIEETDLDNWVTVNFGDRYTYFNLTTCQPLKQNFRLDFQPDNKNKIDNSCWVIVPIETGWRKYAYFNIKTGNFFDSEKLIGFEIYYLSYKGEGWFEGRRADNDKHVLFNPDTGKYLEHEEELDYGRVVNGWAVEDLSIRGVEDEMSEYRFRYINPNTGQVCSKIFARAGYVGNEGWAKVQGPGGSTHPDRDDFQLYNPKTEKLCERKFDDISFVHDGLAVVKSSNGYFLFDPEKDYAFQVKFKNKEDCTVLGTLRCRPEEFLHLPTSHFRNKAKIKSYLNVIAEQLKASVISTNPKTTSDDEKIIAACSSILDILSLGQDPENKEKMTSILNEMTEKLKELAISAGNTAGDDAVDMSIVNHAEYIKRIVSEKIDIEIENIKLEDMEKGLKVKQQEASTDNTKTKVDQITSDITHLIEDE